MEPQRQRRCGEQPWPPVGGTVSGLMRCSAVLAVLVFGVFRATRRTDRTDPQKFAQSGLWQRAEINAFLRGEGLAALYANCVD
jgi:hypothetical protein